MENYRVKEKKANLPLIPASTIIGNQASLDHLLPSSSLPVLQRLSIHDDHNPDINHAITISMDKVKAVIGTNPLSEQICLILKKSMLKLHSTIEKTITLQELEDICMCLTGWYLGQFKQQSTSSPETYNPEHQIDSDSDSDSGQYFGTSILNFDSLSEEDLGLFEAFMNSQTDSPFSADIHPDIISVIKTEAVLPPPFEVPPDILWFSTEINETLPLKLEESINYIRQSRQIVSSLSTKLNLPPEQIWGMVRDDKHSGHNPFIFENEPNYTLSMLNALCWATQSFIGLTPHTYLELHEKAVGNTQRLIGEGSHYRNIASDTAYFSLLKAAPGTGINGSNASDEGLEEYLAKKRMVPQECSLPLSQYQDLLVKNYTSLKLGQMLRRDTDINQIDTADIKPMLADGILRLEGAKGNNEHEGSILAGQVFENYDMQMDALKKSYAAKYLTDEAYADARLHVIIQTCQTLDQLHLFSDGNIRTIYLLLNVMLHENGFPYTVLDEPNVIDFYSVNEIITFVKAGWEKYNSVPGGFKKAL